MGSCPEPLEHIFQRVERETERRARQEARDELGEPSELFDAVRSSATYQTKQRRRRSITITRFGQLPGPDDRPKSSQGLSRNKRVSTIPEEPSFYQANKNDSVNTFSSEGSAHQDVEEDHTTRVQINVPQGFSKTVQALLPRRLTRSQSVNVVASRDSNMVIGVSIEQATVESETGDEPNQASVHIKRTLRKKPSTLSIAASLPAGKGWLARAKGFTRRFRRTKDPSGPANSVPP